MDCIVWSPGISLEENERSIVENAFKFYKHNKAATAQSLGISVRTLEYKLARYNDASMAVEQQAEARKRAAHDHSLRARGLLPPLVVPGLVDEVTPKAPPPVYQPTAERATAAAAKSAGLVDAGDDDGMGAIEDEMPTPKERQQKLEKSKGAGYASDKQAEKIAAKAAAEA